MDVSDCAIRSTEQYNLLKIDNKEILCPSSNKHFMLKFSIKVVLLQNMFTEGVKHT